MCSDLKLFLDTTMHNFKSLFFLKICEIKPFQPGDRIYMAKSDVCRRQILTHEDGLWYRYNRVCMQKWNKINGPGEPSGDRIRNANAGGLRTSSQLLGHGGSPQYWIFMSEQGRNILFIWTLNVRAGFEPAISNFSSRHLQTLHQPPVPSGGEIEVITIRCSRQFVVSLIKYTSLTFTARGPTFDVSSRSPRWKSKTFTMAVDPWHACM